MSEGGDAASDKGLNELLDELLKGNFPTEDAPVGKYCTRTYAGQVREKANNAVFKNILALVYRAVGEGKENTAGLLSILLAACCKPTDKCEPLIEVALSRRVPDSVRAGLLLEIARRVNGGKEAIPLQCLQDLVEAALSLRSAITRLLFDWTLPERLGHTNAEGKKVRGSGKSFRDTLTDKANDCQEHSFYGFLHWIAIARCISFEMWLLLRPDDKLREVLTKRYGEPASELGALKDKIAEAARPIGTFFECHSLFAASDGDEDLFDKLVEERRISIETWFRGRLEQWQGEAGPVGCQVRIVTPSRWASLDRLFDPDSEVFVSHYVGNLGDNGNRRAKEKHLLSLDVFRGSSFATTGASADPSQSVATANFSSYFSETTKELQDAVDLLKEPILQIASQLHPATSAQHLFVNSQMLTLFLQPRADLGLTTSLWTDLLWAPLIKVIERESDLNGYEKGCYLSVPIRVGGYSIVHIFLAMKSCPESLKDKEATVKSEVALFCREAFANLPIGLYAELLEKYGGKPERIFEKGIGLYLRLSQVQLSVKGTNSNTTNSSLCFLRLTLEGMEALLEYPSTRGKAVDAKSYLRLKVETEEILKYRIGALRDLWTGARKFRLVSERSAQAAVMSRNMSHNIGSHVLSRVGRNPQGAAWYTAQYLEERMDFIAQVATEWPQGTEPAWLLQDIMRWFLYQEDLLENICASENYGAHRYNGHEVKKSIRLHVLLVPDSGDPCALQGKEARATVETWRPSSIVSTVEERIAKLKADCKEQRNGGGASLGCAHSAGAQEIAQDCQRVLLYSDEASDTTVVRIENDQQVAMPQGIIGYHAFYVILENILRNAAKHSSAQQEKNERTESSHLDLVIEILFDPERRIGILAGRGNANRPGEKIPAILVRVYDNLSRVQTAEYERGLRLWGTPGSPGLNDLLQQSLVDDRAVLRRGSWGLAEMKIAAAFLQGRSLARFIDNTEEVTGGRDETDAERMERACGEGSRMILRAVKSPLGTLGYEFFIRRPRLLAIAPVPGKTEEEAHP